MNNDMDDDAWLDALRGRPRAGTDAATLREAEDLRRSILDASRERGADDVVDQRELQRLLFRMRRGGVLSGSASTTKRWRAPLAAAATIALGAALTMMTPTRWLSDEDDTVLRGGVAQVIEVDDVSASMQRLEVLLRAAGAVVVVTDISGGGREIAATVPPERIPTLAPGLASLGVKSPQRDGVLRVEMRAKR